MPPKPIIDLCGISFLCANFETFTIFSAIVLKTCTYPPYHESSAESLPGAILVLPAEYSAGKCRLYAKLRFSRRFKNIGLMMKIFATDSCRFRTEQNSLWIRNKCRA